MEAESYAESVPNPRGKRSGIYRGGGESKVALYAAIVGTIGVLGGAYITAVWGPEQLKLIETRQAELNAKVIATTGTIAIVNAQAAKASEQVNQLQAATPGTLQQGQKLCMVMLGKQWKDGLVVPQGWNINLCMDYMRKTGGTKYRLGCVYNDNVVIGGENGTIPDRNCGWQ